MFFSGVAQSYRCPKCNIAYSNIIPTSIVPMLLVLLFSCALWTGAFVGVLGDHWWTYLLALSMAAMSIPTTIVLLQRSMAPWTNSLLCTECQSKLEVVGGGFVDGGAPSSQEILLYLLVIGVPLAVWNLAAIL